MLSTLRLNREEKWTAERRGEKEGDGGDDWGGMERQRGGEERGGWVGWGGGGMHAHKPHTPAQL